MQRRLLALLISLLLLVPLLAACADADDPGAVSDIRLYQVLPVARKSELADTEGQGEVIALINAGAESRTLSGWSITGQSGGKVTLPRLTLAPGAVTYLANDAEYFRQYWNFLPTYEYGQDTDKAVPDLKLPERKAPVLHDEGDVVRLLDDKGRLIDMIVYGNVTDAPAPWSGEPVKLVNSFPLQPGNQVITRLKEGEGFRMAPAAASFSGGTLTQPERVYFAGQSDFPVRSVSGPITLTAASAPDNSGPLLYTLVDEAKRSIKLTGYQFNSKELAARLVAAVQQGVRVQVAIERNPGGSDMYDSDKEAQEILHKGGVDIIYYHKWDGDLSSRFNPTHAKYAIFDDEAVLLGTGNYTTSVWPVTPECGNREWMAVLRGSSDVVQLFSEIWESDFGSDAADLRGYSEQLDRPLAPDTYDSGPCIRYTPVKAEPLTVTGEATVTRILSPDNTLDRENGFLGLLRGAKSELLVSAAYIYKWWGPASASENFTQYPQPYLTEIVAAARRGVAVKVLLDARHARADSLRDNQHVVAYLNELAHKENLKLEARLVSMAGTGIGRTYHNKSLIVDDAVVISSINGSENSFRYAREVALKVAGVPAFTGYYRDLFLADWKGSEGPNAPQNLRASPRRSGTFINWSANVELDVVRYAVSYKSQPEAAWQPLGEVTRPGFEDSGHATGIWGVVAVTRDGRPSLMAEISR